MGQLGMVLVWRQGTAVEFIEIIDGLLYIVLFQVFISFVNVFDPIYGPVELETDMSRHIVHIHIT